MSEDIRKWSDGRYTLMFDEHTFFVWDNEKDERMTALNVTKKLNEQQSVIKEQYERIRELENILADDIVRKSEIKEVWKQRTEKRWNDE